MRANCSIWTTVLLLLLSAGSVASAQEVMPWAADLESAKQLAAQKNQLVMVHFWAPNCPPCRMLEATLFRDPQFAAAVTQDFVPVKVNAAEEAAIASKYGVDRWPQDVIILPNGQMIYRMVSRQEKDKEQYLSMLHAVAVKAAGMPMLASNGAAPDSLPVSYPGEAPAATGGYSRFGNAPSTTPETAAAPPTQSRFSTPPASSYAQNNAPPAATPATTQSRFSAGGYADRNASAAAAPQTPQQPQQPSGYAAGVSAAAGAAQSGQPTSPAQTQSRFAAQPSAAPYGQGSQFSQQPPAQAAPPAQSRFATQPSAPPAASSQFASQTMTQPQPQSQIQSQPAAQSAAPTPQAAQQKPEFALDGFCPVTLAEKGNWQKGDARWGAVHQGRVYLFASAAEQRMFLATPDRFSPVLSGNDPVAYIDQGRLVDGDRTHGLTYNGVLYLFASEQNLEAFWASPQRYAAQVQQAMLRNSQQLR